MYIFMGNKGAIKRGSVQGLKGMEMTERKLIKKTHNIGLLAEMGGCAVKTDLLIWAM